MDDLVEREGIYYEKFTDVPFSGKVTGKTTGRFVNGKFEGSFIGYYDNGQLKTRGNYVDGKSDGLWKSFDEVGW